MNVTGKPDIESDDPDLSLFRRARTGDFRAFEELLGRLQHRVYGLAFRILGSPQDAEDIVQQTFMNVVEHLDSFREESSVAAWVLRIAANHSLKLIRKRRGLPTVPLNEADDSEESYAEVPHPQVIASWRDDPVLTTLRRETRGLIDQALFELEEKYRVVFILRDIEGFSVQETADLLGISESNVKVRLLRARLMLREKLTPLMRAD